MHPDEHLYWTPVQGGGYVGPSMNLALKLLVSLLAGLLVFAGMGYLLDWEKTLAALTTLDLAYLPLILGLAILNYLFRFIKWHYYLKILGLEVPVGTSWAIYVSGFMMAVTPGKLGEVVKSFLLKRMYGVKMRVTAPVILAERITDVISLLVLCMAGAATLRYGERALVATAVVTVLGLTVLSSRRLATLCISACEKIPVIDRVAHKFHDAHDSMAVLIAPRPLILATLVSIPAWAAEGVAFYMIFVGMNSSGAGAGPPLTGAIFIYSFSTLVGGLSMLPGGLGAAEAGLAGLAVALFSVPSGLAAAATLVVRILTLWFAVGLGLATFAWNRQRFGIGFDDVASASED